MNKETYNKIMLELQNRRSLAFSALQEKEAEVYSKIPEIEEINKKLRLSGVRFSKLALMGDDSAGEKLKSEMLLLNDKKQRLLQENNFSNNYLKPAYFCSLCNDTGYIGSGNTTAKCNCFKQLMIELLYKDSNIKASKEENFKTFNEMLYPDKTDPVKYGIKKSPRQNILGIREKCMSFVSNFDAPREKSMFFSGPVGTGKTFMLNCIALELLNGGKTVLYLTAPALFDVITNYKRRGFNDEDFDDTLYKNIFVVDLLIIDDLGTESHTSSRYAELLNILNTRDGASRPCKTLISTNSDVSQLSEYYTERVESRIIGSYTLLKFAGEDIRRLKKERGALN